MNVTPDLIADGIDAFAVIAQILGAAIFVFDSRRTRLRLLKHVGNNLDKIGPAIDALLDELRAQYHLQLWAFACLLVGFVLQFVAMIVRG